MSGGVAQGASGVASGGSAPVRKAAGAREANAINGEGPEVEIAALDNAAFDGLPDEAVFTVEEVARLLRVANSTIYTLVKQRRLPSLHLGHKIPIPRRALVGYLRGMDAETFDSFIKRKASER